MSPCRHALQNAELRQMISSSHFLRRPHELISTPQTNGPSKLTFKSELREQIGVGSSTRILSSNRVNVRNAGETYRHPTVGRLQHSKARNGRLLPAIFSEFGWRMKLRISTIPGSAESLLMWREPFAPGVFQIH